LICRLLGQNLITIRVGTGENSQVHSVHKKLISKHSAYFDAAINGGFREAIQQEIVLEEEDPLIFEFFLTWVYTSSLPSVHDYLEISISRREDVEFLFLRLYGMADRFIAPGLQILAYERIRETLSHMAPWEAWVKELYEITDPKSQLRQYIVLCCVHDILKGDAMGLWDDVLEYEAFAADVSRITARRGALQDLNNTVHPHDMEEYRQLRTVVAMRAALTSSEGLPRHIIGNALKRDSDGAPHPLIKGLITRMDMAACQANLRKNSVKWPHQNPSTSAMRAAGFFHYPEDEPELHDQVKCIHCDMEFFGWMKKEQPFTKHRETRPQCPFVVAVEMGLEPPLLPYF
jgi:Inhibitor of Apoptosis domain/BTB/POZ domain